jgi:hypothetical protein
VRRAIALGVGLGFLLLPVLPALSTASPPGLRELVEGAAKARDRGAFEESLRLLEDAYRLAPTPALLNNLAQVLEALGRYSEAYEDYRKVAQSADADRALREFDASRMTALAPKISRAFVHGAPSNKSILRIDGSQTLDETELDPDRLHTVECHADGSAQAVLRFMRFPAGVRTTLGAELELQAHDAHLVLAGPDNRLLELRVNEYQVRSAPSLESLILDPGHYALRIEYEHTAEPVSLELDLGLSETRTVVPGRAPSATAPQTMVVTAPPPSPPPPPPAVSPWPFLTLGLGAGAIATGVGFLVMASASRDTLNTECPPLLMSCSVSRGAAYDLQSTGDRLTVVGSSLIAAGAAAAVGGLVWWLLGS